MASYQDDRPPRDPTQPGSGPKITTTFSLLQPHYRCTRCHIEANVLSMGPNGGERLCSVCSPQDLITLAETDRCPACHQELPLTHA